MTVTVSKCPTAPGSDKTTRELRDERRALVRDMTARGMARGYIAELLGVDRTTVHRDQVAIGMVPPNGRKMTDDEITLARRLDEDDCPVTEIARTIGRSRDTVYAITAGHGVRRKCGRILHGAHREMAVRLGLPVM